jgi:hypothetical protein
MSEEEDGEGVGNKSVQGLRQKDREIYVPII